jgi:hypothetical protein
MSPAGATDAALVVAKRLALDGLLLCTAKAMATLRQHGAAPAETVLEWLKGAGLPTDLLGAFVPESGDPSPLATVAWIDRLLGGTAVDKLRPVFEKARCQFRPSIDGFTAFADSGQTPAGCIRLQLSRGGYYAGPGDGGSLDLLRQLLEQTDSRVLIQVEQGHVDELCAHAAEWPAAHRKRLTICAQPLPLSQWAQDSGKAGSARDGEPVTLVPRFASRGEDAAQFVPGDSCIEESLMAVGERAARSPLLFQGGNMLTVEEPGGRRTLLVGEAEVLRNQALGLSRDQVLGAFAVEFGVNRCAVLPAASIHLDYEVSVRTRGDEIIALVNHTASAVRMILAAGLRTLADGNVLDAAEFSDAVQHVDHGRARELRSLILPTISAGSTGQFPLTLATQLRRGAADSGVGSLQRFLGALDTFTALSPAALASLADPYEVAFLLSIAHQERDRAALRRQLQDLGWNVAAIPSLALGNRSINAINGIHTPNAYLMPAYGGLFEALDRASAAAVIAALGAGVQVVPIRSGESQRRDGAVHCSVGLMRAR